MSGWTMVNSQGDVFSGDDGSESSDSSIEVISLEDVDVSETNSEKETVAVDQPNNEALNISEAPGEKEDLLETGEQRNDTFGLDLENDFKPVNEMQLECSSLTGDDNTNQDDNQTLDVNPVQSLGACCAELLMEQNVSVEPEEASVMSSVRDTFDEEPAAMSSVPDTFDDLNLDVSIDSLDPPQDDILDEDSESGSDDFVCLEPMRREEMNVAAQERDQGRVVIPFRVARLSSSIGSDFNFIRNQEIRHESDADDRDEDTESSTEDSFVDDRIESEQSEIGSNSQDNYDVGDLSSFDIGDIPIDVGNVARNYRHQPNTNLSHILNTILILSAILTMGISLGISMATDLEIEEWQNAYEMESEKVKNLEEQALTLEKLWNHYKREATELEELVTLQDKREEAFYMMKMHASDKDRSFHFVLENLQEIRLNYQKCVISKQFEPDSCFSSISPSLTKLKAAIMTYDPADDVKESGTTEEPTNILEDFNQNPVQAEDVATDESVKDFYSDTDEADSDITETTPSAVSTLEQTDEKEIKEILIKEITTDVHENKKEKDSVKIALDVRQLQQSLTREQERALHWQQLYLSERRQREKERENEEWEDERDRDRWEEERLQADKMECLEKLMSTNLTTLTQHVMKWNVSVFDDFANLSMLMSIVSELQQSVVNSVHRVWEEAQEVLDHQEETSAGRSDEETAGRFTNKEDAAKYFQQLFKDVKEEMEEVLKDETEPNDEFSKQESSQKSKSEESSRNKKIFGKIVNVLKKAKKSVKTLGKQVVGFFGKVHNAWQDREIWMTKMSNFFSKDSQTSSSNELEKLCRKSLNKWHLTDKEKRSWVNVRSKCVSMVRSDWERKILENPCQQTGICDVNQQDVVDRINGYSRYADFLSDLKKIKPSKLKSSDAKYCSITSGMFGEFLNTYRKIGLHVDLKWAQCSMKWWSDALNAIHTHKKIVLKENKCDWVEIPFSFADSSTQGEIVNSLQYLKEDLNKYDFDFTTKEKKRDDDDDEKGKTFYNNYEKEKGKILIVEYTKKSNDSLNKAPAKKTSIEEKKKVKEEESKQRKFKTKKERHHWSGEWQFKNAENREFHRKEDHRSDWLFDRAESRREKSDYAEEKNKRNVPNWYLKQANEREKIRKHDHQADWLFERANDRKEHHRNKKKWFDKKAKRYSHKHQKYSCVDF